MRFSDKLDVVLEDLSQHEVLVEGVLGAAWAAAKVALGLTGAAVHGADAAMGNLLGLGWSEVRGHVTKGKLDKKGRFREIDPFAPKKWRKAGDSLRYARKALVELFDELFAKADRGEVRPDAVVTKLKEELPEAVPVMKREARKLLKIHKPDTWGGHSVVVPE